MIVLALNVLIALVCATLLGSFSALNLLTGFASGYFVLWAARPLMGLRGKKTRYFRALPQGFLLTAFFLKELVKSCLIVARDCVAPRPNLHPAIFKMPLDVRSDAEIVLLANLITLTPGTMTLDVAEDRGFLVIHSIYAQDPEALVAELKGGMEHRVKEVFRR